MRAQPRRSHCSSQLINFHRLPSTPRARGIVAADFDRNGWIDLAHANFGSNTVTILLNQRRSDPAFVRAMDVPVGAGPFDLATGDFNCDGIVDLAVANADAHTISILTGRSSGGFTRVDLPAPRGPRGIDAAHVNDDGWIDLIVTGWESGTVQVLMGNGAGGFATGPAFSGYAPHPQGVDTADFNRDGHPDLVIAYESAGGIAVLSGNGGTAFTAHVAADVNHDGMIDVVTANRSNGTVSVLLGREIRPGNLHRDPRLRRRTWQPRGRGGRFQPRWQTRPRNGKSKRRCCEHSLERNRVQYGRFLIWPHAAWNGFELGGQPE
ncbi:MAG TPA: VCBS repeat-containing protein [Vicinamibacterales bacterium]|jgi:hypothetical protein|nr:VCBS repeat-containing protein [Vicinamibacterales bacterium]